MRRSDWELMAPAGSEEALSAAIEGGADSVYFGVGRLNMRAHAAGNFRADDLPRVMDRCRAAGVNGYLTVNTVLYDEELAEMKALMTAAAKARVSAVIASDMAAVLAAREVGLPVHLSTQLNISNTEALAFYAQYAETAVLARELNLNQVRCIADAVRDKPILGTGGEAMRLEMFCHGALCMGMSGRCWMSLHTRGKSANRGECLQNCRRTYNLVDRERGTELALENGYVLSPKDLKTIDFLDKMTAAGVTVFKIEGRARGADYVRTVTTCYDEALKSIADGTYGSCATEKKVLVGRLVNYFAKAHVAQAEILAGTVKPGEKLLVTGPTTGAVYAEPECLMDDAGTVTEASRGMRVTFKVPEIVRAGDKLYRLEPAER